MEEWKEYKLGDLYAVHNGLSKGGKFFGSGYPFLSFKTVFNNYFLPPILPDLVQSNEKEQNGYSIKRGDVFVTRTSETPEELGMSSVALKDYPFATYNGFTKRLRPKNPSLVFPEFIGYYLRSTKFRNFFYGLASSMSTRASLANGDLLGIRIFLPSYETQERIAWILKSLDDKIELNRRINKNLEQQAQALFKSWFVDFEPFQDGKFVDSELGMIPEGWKVVETNKVMRISKESINPTKNPNRFYAHYSIPAFDEIGLPIFQYGNEIKSNKQKVFDNMTLVSKLNPRIKRVWFIDKACENAICSTEFIPYLSLNNSPYFLYCYLNSNIFYDSIMSSVNGATGSHQRFQANDTLKFLFPYNEEVICKFNSIVSGVLIHKSRLINENMRLSQLRDTLLPKLMSGELKINDFND